MKKIELHRLSNHRIKAIWKYIAKLFSSDGNAIEKKEVKSDNNEQRDNRGNMPR